MSEQPKAERPSSLVRKPRPAADEQVDPVDYQTPAPTPSPAPAPAAPAATPTPTPPPAAEPEGARRPKLGRPKAKREATVPFSTRIAVSLSEMLDEAAEREGITIRSALEHAIRNTYGKPGEDAGSGNA